MAIVIEQDKKGFNWFALGIVVLVVGGLGGIAYYLFFAPTPFIEKVAPSELKSLKNIALIEFNPDAIINDPAFKILKSYTNPVLAPNVELRINPFLPQIGAPLSPPSSPAR